MLTIIVPCLNEEDNISMVLNAIDKIMSKIQILYEVIIVDDKSTDNTSIVANKWILDNKKDNYRVLYKDLDRRGYGAVIKYGLAYASGDYVIFISADLVDPIDLIPKMVEMLDQGADLVQCSRYLNKSDSNTIPFSYKFFQFFFRRFVKIALGISMPDSTYAFKMFKRRKILSMGISSNRFNISPEIMFKAVLGGLDIKFIPGSQGVRAQGVSKFYFRKEGAGFINCLLRAFLHRKKIIFWY
jgi:dolichol-phosphate mannosyltransferase